MGLGFGGNMFPREQVFLGYRQSAANQKEIYKYTAVSAAGYTEIFVVPAGKTYYFHAIVNTGGGHIIFATGAAASEVDFMKLAAGTSQSFSIPLKFSAGTRVSADVEAGQTDHITFVGWEE